LENAVIYRFVGGMDEGGGGEEEGTLISRSSSVATSVCIFIIATTGREKREM
jgi:hypothetical protein